MARYHKKVSKKAGMPPGSLVHVGEHKARLSLELIAYNEESVVTTDIKNWNEAFHEKYKDKVKWINFTGLQHTEYLEELGKLKKIHHLLLEDILNTDQRPKAEDFTDYYFVVLKMARHAENEDKTDIEQISMLFGEDYVITFQEKEGDVFQSVRDRILNGKGSLRKRKVDYLAYALIDSVIDNYFIVLENLGNQLEELELSVLEDPTPELLNQIHQVRRDVFLIRKSVWPAREAIHKMEREEVKLISPETNIYLRDVYDHTIHLIDNLETFRELLSSILDIYLSTQSHKLNQVTKLLTIIATIFIPLTFLAGVYGMNFEYMPELEWKWAYFAVLTLMFSIGVGMLFYFKKMKWF